MALVMDAKTPTGTGELLNFCLHYALEEGANPETTCLQRLRANVEQHVDNYTCNYPCLVEGGFVVHHGYSMCPHCQGTKVDHLVQLIRLI